MLIDLSDENYVESVENFQEAIFIDFYSPSCGPCQEVLPLLPHIDSYFDSEVMVAKVNVAQNPKLAKKFEIQSVPFCVSIDKKTKMIKDYELGPASTDRYIRMIEKARGKKGGLFGWLFS